MGNNRSLSSPVDHRYLIIKCYLSLSMSVFLMFTCLSVLLLSVPYFSKVFSLLNVFHASLFFLTWICQEKSSCAMFFFFFFSNINSPESFLVFSQIILTRVFVPLQPLLRPSLLPSRQRKMTCCHWRRTEFDWTMTRMRTRSSSALSVYCTHFRSWGSFCTFKTHFCFSTIFKNKFWCVCLKLLEEEGLEAVMGGAEMIDKEPPPVSVPEEKKPTLSLEELEAKQGKGLKKNDNAMTVWKLCSSLNANFSHVCNRKQYKIYLENNFGQVIKYSRALKLPHCLYSW